MCPVHTRARGRGEEMPADQQRLIALALGELEIAAVNDGVFCSLGVG